MIKQKNNKDCMQCCLSELLDIPYEEIPEFYKYYEDNEDEYFYELDEWLKSNGYSRLLIDVKLNDGVIEMPFYYSFNKFKCIGILKKNDREHSHAVIVNYADGYINIDDPKINSDYEGADLVQLEFIFNNSHRMCETERASNFI